MYKTWHIICNFHMFLYMTSLFVIIDNYVYYIFKNHVFKYAIMFLIVFYC